MRVILQKDIKGLGRKNDVKDVHDGHARNFLIPKGLAKPATAEILQTHERHLAADSAKAAAHKEKLSQLAVTLAKKPFEFYLKTDAHGSVFGSVTKDAIAEALRKAGGLPEDERIDVQIEHPVRAFGETKIPVGFREGVTGEITVIVRPQP